jgi:hypothetical protein
MTILRQDSSSIWFSRLSQRLCRDANKNRAGLELSRDDRTHANHRTLANADVVAHHSTHADIRAVTHAGTAANGYLGSNMDEAANANIMINLNSKVDNAMSADPRA